MTAGDASVERALADLVAALREGLGGALRAVVLFGSAAEDRLRLTSDVNVIVVLRTFDAAAAERVADAARLAHAAARIEAMLLLESEIADAASHFAMKFADVLRRRRVLHGDDPFASLAISRADEARGVRQSMLNLVLRLRERALLAPDARIADVLADAAGPLRAAAASIVALEGGSPASPRAALAQVAPSLGVADAGAALDAISAAREAGGIAPAAARTALWTSIGLAHALHDRAARIGGASP